MNDLETLIRSTLIEDADLAPRAAADWSGLDRYEATPSSRNPWLTVGAVGLAAAAMAGAVALRAQTTNTPAASTKWTPPGIEFPLKDLGPADSSDFITTNGLSRRMSVEGQPVFTVYATVVYQFGLTAEQQRCLSQARGGAGCSPEWNVVSEDIGGSSTVDNGLGTYDVWTWASVPIDAAYVTYADGPETRWQRPVAGVAIFPQVTGNDEIAVAYGADGRELRRTDAASRQREGEQSNTFVQPRQSDVGGGQFEELRTLTAASMTDCLQRHGGAFTSGSLVATFPADIDQPAVWSDCVSATKASVTARLGEMNVRTFDPTKERAQAADSPIRYECVAPPQEPQPLPEPSCAAPVTPPTTVP
jgi:hypothetical protein